MRAGQKEKGKKADQQPTQTVILQRVLSASVTVDKEMISSIGKGVLAFAAVAPGDTEKEADLMAAKVLRMKLWDDEEGIKAR
jgi:D-tyrosyl-tRNA(Tyr) deacylase